MSPFPPFSPLFSSGVNIAFARTRLQEERHVIGLIPFICANCFKRARRQERFFDIIITAPPSFARLKKPRRTFTVARELKGFLAEALTVLRAGGVLLVCINHRELGRDWLRQQDHMAAGERAISTLPTPALPIDFAGDSDYSKSVIVRAG